MSKTGRVRISLCTGESNTVSLPYKARASVQRLLHYTNHENDQHRKQIWYLPNLNLSFVASDSQPSTVLLNLNIHV